MKWVRHGTPIPEGWRIAKQELTHHHDHAVLVEKINEGE